MNRYPRVNELGVVRLLRLTTGIVKVRTYDFVIPVAKSASVRLPLSFFVGTVSGSLTWHWLDGWSSQRALAAHFEGGKAYARAVLEEVGVVPDELQESSGLAISRTQPGVLWSHNDSGDGPTLYAIDMSGKLLAQIKRGQRDGSRLGGHLGRPVSRR